MPTIHLQTPTKVWHEAKKHLFGALHRWTGLLKTGQKLNGDSKLPLCVSVSITGCLKGISRADNGWIVENHGCCVLQAKEEKDHSDGYLHQVWKPAPAMEWGGVSALGMGNLHICQGIIVDRYFKVLKQHTVCSHPGYIFFRDIPSYFRETLQQCTLIVEEYRYWTATCPSLKMLLKSSIMQESETILQSSNYSLLQLQNAYWVLFKGKVFLNMLVASN